MYFSRGRYGINYAMYKNKPKYTMVNRDYVINYVDMEKRDNDI